MEWTDTDRLYLIAIIVSLCPIFINKHEKTKIMYLCTKPSSFLENNKHNYTEEIEILRESHLL